MSNGVALLLVAGALLALLGGFLLLHGHGTTETASPSLKAGEYEVVHCEESNPLPLGAAPLSSYTPQDIRVLPRCRRIVCKVVVGTCATRETVNQTVEAIISEKTTSDPDLDVITLFLYSTEDRTPGMYDVATALWSPDGVSYDTTFEVAASNTRTGYVLNVQIRKDLESYLASISASETVNGLDEPTRREVFRVVTQCEDAAYWEACKRYDPHCLRCGRFVANDRLLLSSYIDSYEARCRERLMRKHRITGEELDAIMLEGLEKNWPMSTPISPPSCCG